MQRPPQRLLAVFLDEALDGLATIAGYIEGGGQGSDTIDRAFRCAHSLAVNSRLLGFDRTAESADSLEDVLLACRATSGRLASDRAASLLVDVHALPIVIREELRQSFALDSTEPLEGRIKQTRELVDRVIAAERTGNA